ncbi:MAG: TonB-dependent receptor, partial [Muribaculaceae bacterium]|nr:TonB-dependent receptor [Muribaculaceae bacterium]
MKKWITIIGLMWLWAMGHAAVTSDIPVTQGDTVSLNEVTVTAIKQSADLRTQATALTVIGNEEAQRNQVVSAKTAADLVPNLFIPDYGSRMTSTVYVRGIGTRIDQP